MTDKTLLPDVIYADIGGQMWSPFSGSPCVKYIRADLAEVQPSPEGKDALDRLKKKMWICGTSIYHAPKSGRFIDAKEICKCETVEQAHALLKAVMNATLQSSTVEIMTRDKLRSMMADPKYWHEKDPEFIKQVTQGFKDVFAPDTVEIPAENLAALETFPDVKDPKLCKGYIVAWFRNYNSVLRRALQLETALREVKKGIHPQFVLNNIIDKALSQQPENETTD